MAFIGKKFTHCQIILKDLDFVGRQNLINFVVLVTIFMLLVLLNNKDVSDIILNNYEQEMIHHIN